MSPRSIRRAAERRQRKLLKKQNRALALAAQPDEAATALAPTPEIGSVSQQPEAAPDTKPGFVSQTRAEINRANARHSTGPRTDTGKLASSRNSLKHGLASGTLIIAGEDPAEFDALLESLLADHQPASATEEMLVHEIARSLWLAQRTGLLVTVCALEKGAPSVSKMSASRLTASMNAGCLCLCGITPPTIVRSTRLLTR